MSELKTGVTVVVTVHVALDVDWSTNIATLSQVFEVSAQQAKKAVTGAIASDQRLILGEVTTTQVRVLKDGGR